MEQISIRIYSPAGLVLEDKTSAVTLQASDGQIGILPRHIRYTGVLGTGELKYVSAAGNEPKSISVAGGFCRFSADTLVVLADSAG